MGDKPQNSGSRPNPRGDFGDAVVAGAFVTAATPGGRAVAVDATVLAAKYGYGTVKLAGSALAVTGAPLVLGWTGYQTVQSFQEGKAVQGLMNIVPAIPEIYEVGVAGLAMREGLKQGLWQAAKIGGARLATGTSFAVGVGGGLLLTLAVDVGMTAAHEAGWNVDNGFLASHLNQLQNAEAVAGALFPGDTAPFQQDILTLGVTQTLKQTGPYEWDTQTMIPNMAGIEGGFMPPTILEGRLVQTGIGNFADKELKYFSTFHGNFPAVDVAQNGEIRILAGKDGKPLMDGMMNEVAKNMYENPDQAMGLFRDFLYSRTIKTALSIAQERNIRVNGGQVLNESDKIPPALMREAAEKTLKNMRGAYTLGGDQYFMRALAYTDPEFIKPENINIAKLEAYRFIESRFQGRVESYMDAKGGFDWGNSTHLAQIHSAIDKAIETNRPAGPRVAPAPRVRTSGAPVTEALNTRLNANQIHEVNQSVIKQVTTGYLADSEQPLSFDSDKIRVLQNQLVQAGYLSGSHDTGNMNGYTMRAIDKAIRAEITPDKITGDDRLTILERATDFASILKESPGDPTAFDPRALTFQTSAYLLGLYDGKLDGLAGAKTTAAMEKLEQLQQTPTAAITPDSVLAPQNAVPATPNLEPTGP